MNRIDRVSAILIQLQTKRYVTAEEIAERFGLSKRTIYRDIRALEEAGIPVGAEPGKGFYLVDGFHLPPVRFTQNEALTLLTAAKMLTRISDKGMRENMQSALCKIKAVLPDVDKQNIARLDDKIEVFISSPEMSNHDSPGNFLTEIQRALSIKKVLQIDYFSGYKNECTLNRELEPLGLCFYGMHWHLVAYCRLRGEYRDFRVDRIQRLEVLEEVCVERAVSSISQYFNSLYRPEDIEEVVLRFDKEQASIISSVKYYYGFIDEKVIGNKVEMTFVTSDMGYMGRWLLMYADVVEIVSPDKLTEILAHNIRNLRSITV
jgi:predicted DNA-binding transcriptional regulator YafY